MNGREPVPGTRCFLFYLGPRQCEVFAKAILKYRRCAVDFKSSSQAIANGY